MAASTPGHEALQCFVVRQRDRGVMGAGIGNAERVMKFPPWAAATEVRAINLIDFNRDE